MARKPVTAKPGKMILKVSNGADPEVLTAPCGLTSKSITFSASFGETRIPNCDDPDAATWLARNKHSLSAAITGEGVLAAESVQTWSEFLGSSASRSIEITIGFSTGTMTWAGLFHLENFAPSGEDTQGTVMASIGLQSDGEVIGTWAAAG